MKPQPWLAPLTPFYRAGLAWREHRLASGAEPVRRLRFPVISVGNLSTGGSGKTPFVIALARALTLRGIYVDVLSRGYGRLSSVPLLVDPGGSAQQFGDEPLLIARQTSLRVYVAPQRYDAGMLAEREFQGPAAGLPRAVHLLDDGFQHRQLHRDIDIVLIDERDRGDRLLPAGNLREPPTAAARAGILAVPAESPALEAELRARGLTAPIWRLKRRMEIPGVSGPAAAFCAIARPTQFFAGLESAGLELALKVAFPDHHPFKQGDLDRLTASARAAGAGALITTEKDMVRLGALRPGMPLVAVPLETTIENQDAAVDWLLSRLGRADSASPL